MLSANRQAILNNLFWFLSALILAVWVWFTAITDQNPINETRFTSIPVQIAPDDGLIVTNTPTNTVRVNVRAQQSVLDNLRRDDVVVQATLAGLSSGTHIVPLTASVAQTDDTSFRNVIVDTLPSQITVVLERVETQLRDVTIEVVGEPPIGFTYDPNELLPSIRQVEISGASSLLPTVASVVGELDLSNERNTTSIDVRLTPVDANGNPVGGITLNPLNARVSVDVSQRDDVRQVSVRPDIQIGTQPEGYTLATFSAQPQTIFIGGNPDDLASLPSVFFTEPIDLTGRTESFEVSVAVLLPNDDVFIVGSENRVDVSIGIEAQIASTQFNNIPIAWIGIEEDQQVQIIPETVSVVLTGPEAIVDNLTADNIQVLLDLNGYANGNYDLVPSVIVNQGAISQENTTLSPSIINVIITANAEVTEVPTPEE